MTVFSRRQLVLGSAALMLAGSACNKALRNNAEALFEALHKNDYAAVKKVAGSELLKDLSEDEFGNMARIYAALGSRSDLTQTATSINNGTSEIRFTATFAEGPTEWVFRSKREDLIDGLEVEGEGWKTAQAKTHQQALEDLLAALGSQDHERFLKLLHPETRKEVTAEKFREIASFVSSRGKRQAIKEQEQGFRLVFENGEVEAKTQLRGGLVGAFNFAPAK
jgi:hypothetical protein